MKDTVKRMKMFAKDIREIQIKTTMRYYHIHIRITKIQNTNNSKC